MPHKLKEYALYQGDDLLTIGTVHELAAYQNVKVETIRFMSSPTYTNRRKPGGNHLIVVKMEDDEECFSN